MHLAFACLDAGSSKVIGEVEKYLSARENQVDLTTMEKGGQTLLTKACMLNFYHVVKMFIDFEMRQKAPASQDEKKEKVKRWINRPGTKQEGMSAL